MLKNIYYLHLTSQLPLYVYLFDLFVLFDFEFVIDDICFSGVPTPKSWSREKSGEPRAEPAGTTPDPAGNLRPFHFLFLSLFTSPLFSSLLSHLTAFLSLVCHALQCISLFDFYVPFVFEFIFDHILFQGRAHTQVLVEREVW